MAGLFAVIAAALSILLTIAVAGGRLDALDEAVRAAVAASRTAGGIRWMLSVSHISSEYGTPATVLLVAGAVYSRHRRWAAHLVVVSFTSTLWQIALKHLLERPRPLPPLVPYLSGAGYPSGHVLTAVCLVMMLWVMVGRFEAVRQPSTNLWPRWALSTVRTLLLSWPLLVAWSRVYIDSHWLTDVLAGAILGLMHFMAWYYLHGWQMGLSEHYTS